MFAFAAYRRGPATVFTPRGGVPRLWLPKVREDAPSVQDFGARGDGLKNDTLAIQRALNRGGTLTVPPGTYMVDKLTIGKATTLVMSSGATIRKIAGTTGKLITINTNNVAIVGPGDGTAVIDNNDTGAPNDPQGTEPIFALQRAVLTIAGIAVRNSNNYGIHFETCSRVEVRNCHFSNIEFDSFINSGNLFDDPFDDCKILDNFFDRRGTGFDTSGDHHCISFIAGDVGSLGSRILIQGNTCLCKQAGLGVGISVFSGLATFPVYQDVICADNHVIEGLFGITINGVVGCAITGNTVLGAVDIGIELAVDRFSTVSGNAVRGPSQIGISITGVVGQDNAINSICGNSISGTTAQGILASASAGDQVIAGNVVQVSGGQGINITSGGNHTVTGNHLDGQNLGSKAIEGGGGGAAVVTGNHARRWTVASTLPGGSVNSGNLGI